MKLKINQMFINDRYIVKILEIKQEKCIVASYAHSNNGMRIDTIHITVNSLVEWCNLVNTRCLTELEKVLRSGDAIERD